MGFQHRVIIHKYKFVTQQGVHTHYIENVWADLKLELKRLRGSQDLMLDGHIDEYFYCYNRKHEGKIFDLMLQDIATFYPV